jgi:hypothetical protein
MLAAIRKWTHREPVLMWTAYWSIAGALPLPPPSPTTPDRSLSLARSQAVVVPPPSPAPQKTKQTNTKSTGLSAPLFIHAFTSGPSEPKIKHPPTIKEVLQAMAPKAQPGQPAAPADDQ